MHNQSSWWHGGEITLLIPIVVVDRAAKIGYNQSHQTDNGYARGRII